MAYLYENIIYLNYFKQTMQKIHFDEIKMSEYKQCRNNNTKRKYKFKLRCFISNCGCLG